jgi:dimethylglycine dehydrogenase
MDRRFKVAVIGGGVAGCSVAYHLALHGCAETVVLEADDLTSGSTWHAAGLCTQFNASWHQMRLLRTSVQLYDGGLEADTGVDVGYQRCGSLRLAATPERVDELHARQAMAHALGIPFEIVGPDRIAELWPLARFDDVLAAAWLPTDGWVDPARLTQAYAAGARQRGAEVLRRARVRSLQRVGAMWTVETTAGAVVADVVVNAAGMWARQVGRLAGVDHPISPLLHQYLTTVPLPEVEALEREMPVLRDPVASYYVRQDQGSLLVGPFERRPRSWALDGVPDDFHARLLDPDLEQIQDVLATVAERVPAFDGAGIRTVVHGPDGYTPDGRCLMGPVPGVPGYHVLAGFSIFGIVFSGGAGQYAAEWILSGQPSDSMWDVDVRRFGDYASGISYTEARAKESYEREYAVHFPHEELEAGRPLKTDPLYDRLGARGAVWGARFGWERPLWFAGGVEGAGPAVDRDERTFRRARWHSAVGDECRGVAAGVGVLDQTSFGKYLVSGPGAADFLERLCANRLPPADGRIALTQLCNPQGGIECDLTVTRLATDHFYVVSAAATETHDLAWITDHAPATGVNIANMTPAVGVLTIAGPRSRVLLERLAAFDCSDAGIPFFSAVETRVGASPARVMRLSYVGEMGYELHVPVEYLRYVYDRLQDAGSDLGLVDFGYRALESMRMEKCYRLWGADLTSDYTPFEAGLARFVKLKGRSFIGNEALAAQAEAGVRRRLCCLDVEAADADAEGYEPVYRNTTVIGYVTSGAYGHRVGRSLALAYLPVEEAEPGTTLGVEILGLSRLATVVAQPVYDPAGERMFGK